MKNIRRRVAWVSIKNKTPDLLELVLATNKEGTLYIGYFSDQPQSFKILRSGDSWYDDSGFGWNRPKRKYLPSKEITHWMRIPKLPGKFQSEEAAK